MTSKSSGAAGDERSREANGSAIPPKIATTEQRYDAGMRDGNHYASKLPTWRYAIRQWLIPIVRAETPYLASMQEKLRSPALDSYFASTANLGTHMFFMVMLPILFWCGYTSLGRAMVHVLASGVFWSGFLKDMLCLPRPLSPPLQRITMSGSAALEYGFPSTHSTNAVSVAVYAIHSLQSMDQPSESLLYPVLNVMLYCYAISIVLGRLYCGMHGFFDVVIGSLLGVLMSFAQIVYGPALDDWITQGTYTRPVIVTLVVLLLVRIHPEPADDCPCFDDSVAFAGVVIGIEVGTWHYAFTGYATDHPMPGTVPFDLKSMGLLKACARIILGVLIIFAWRGLMKPTLLKLLPPLFRFIEHLGLILPRKFFLRASEYTTVPPLRRDDNVIPSASEIPSLLTNLRYPRKRAVSIGPQSAADAYETIAYRQKRRRESMSSTTANGSGGSTLRESASPPGHQKSISDPVDANLLPSPVLSRVQTYDEMMGTGDVDSPRTPLSASGVSDGNMVGPEPQPFPDLSGEEDKEDREIFLKLERPRVRYDVEVVTKLIVYSGIAWLAVEGNPILFEVLGLGLGVPRS